MPSAVGTYVVMPGGAMYPPAVRCTAHLKSGEQCKRMATRGTVVCFHHGAGSPKIKEAARRAVEQAIAELRFASPKAVETLTANLEDDDGRVRNTAADLILRRTVRESVTVEVGGTATVVVKTAGQLVSERLDALAARYSEVEEAAAGYPEPPRPGELAPVVVDAGSAGS